MIGLGSDKNTPRTAEQDIWIWITKKNQTPDTNYLFPICDFSSGWVFSRRTIFNIYEYWAPLSISALLSVQYLLLHFTTISVHQKLKSNLLLHLDPVSSFRVSGTYNQSPSHKWEMAKRPRKNARYHFCQNINSSWSCPSSLTKFLIRSIVKVTKERK